jgi:hypothetical protein
MHAAKFLGRKGSIQSLANGASGTQRARIRKRWLARRSQRPLYRKRRYRLQERFPLLTLAQARPA